MGYGEGIVDLSAVFWFRAWEKGLGEGKGMAWVSNISHEVVAGQVIREQGAGRDYVCYNGTPGSFA